MFCSKCGAAVNQASGFCPNCGQPVDANPRVVAVSVPAPGYVPPPPGAYAGGAPPVCAAAPSTAYAGFWLRLVAHVIDGLIIGIPFGGIILVILFATGALGTLGSMHVGDSSQNAVGVVGLGIIGVYFAMLSVAIVGAWLYYAYCESSSWQGTLGKKALGLFVTDLEGRRVTFGRASGRFFAKIVSGLIPFAIGYIMAGFTAKKQALHDIIASCLVLRRL